MQVSVSDGNLSDKRIIVLSVLDVRESVVYVDDNATEGGNGASWSTA